MLSYRGCASVHAQTDRLDEAKMSSSHTPINETLVKDAVLHQLGKGSSGNKTGTSERMSKCLTRIQPVFVHLVTINGKDCHLSTVITVHCINIFFMKRTRLLLFITLNMSFAYCI